MINFVDLRPRNSELGSEIQAALHRVVMSGTFVGGPFVEAFEDSFADYMGTDYCVGVGNGLDALRLILQALGIGPGDEVIVPAQTFIATWLAVAQVGATPIGVDVEEVSGNIDPALVTEAISSRTRAIVAVHLHGRPADVVALSSICNRHGLAFVEDAAQAHGAEVGGRRIGSWGVAAAFSFYPTKNLGALGDGGAVTTKDPVLAANIRSLRSYGADPNNKYIHHHLGMNSRLDPIQASVLSCFLENLDSWNQTRRDIVHRYFNVCRNLKHAAPLDPVLGLQDSVWHHFVLRSNKRDMLREQLSRLGIQSEVHYPTPPAFAEIFLGSQVVPDSLLERFPVTAQLASQVFSIPLSPWLGTKAHQVEKMLLEVDALLSNSE